MASVVSLTERSHGPAGWSNQELAELYRAAENLNQAGLPVGSESGVTDEGHPWYIFYREDVQEVIVHFARIDGLFIAASAATDDVVQGNSFRSVIQQLLRRQPFVLPMPARASGDLFLHPSVVLTAFIATAYMLSSGEAGQSIEETAQDGDSAPVADTGSDRAPSFRQEITARLEALAARVAELGRSPSSQQEAAASNALELSTVQSAAIASVLAVATASLERDSTDGPLDTETVQADEESGRSDAEQSGGGLGPDLAGRSDGEASQAGTQVVVAQDVAAQVSGQDEVLAADAQSADGANAVQRGGTPQAGVAAEDGELPDDLLSALYGADFAEALIESATTTDGGPADEELAVEEGSAPGLTEESEELTADAGDEAAQPSPDLVAEGDGPDGSDGAESSQSVDAGELAAAPSGALEIFEVSEGFGLGGDGLSTMSGLLETTVSFLSDPADDLLDSEIASDSALEAPPLSDDPGLESASLVEVASEISVLTLDNADGAKETVVYRGGHLEVVGFQRGHDSLVVRDVALSDSSLSYEVTSAGDVIFTFAENDTLTFVGLFSDQSGEALV
ncbi:MAG: hypothetical protein AAF495_21670 [Pseudomonadota bacterium]